MKVKAGKGLEYWCQGKKITENTETNVKVNHDVSSKLINKTMIEIKPKTVSEPKSNKNGDK